MIIHTKTKAEYDELMEILEKDGYLWARGEKPTEFNAFAIDKKDTCIDASELYITHDNRNYISDPVTPFKEWKKNRTEYKELRKKVNPIGHSYMDFVSGEVSDKPIGDYYDTILSECIKIAKERGEQYGTSDENFADIRTILKTIFDLDLTEEQIVQVMIATKLSRDKHKPKEDNMIDLVNYTAILAHFRK